MNVHRFAAVAWILLEATKSRLVSPSPSVNPNTREHVLRELADNHGFGVMRALD